MKFVAIDALSRSGTTLLASVLGSQKGFMATAGVLNEPLAYHHGDWPMSHLQRDLLKSEECNPLIDIHEFKNTEFQTIKDDFKNRSCGLTIGEWENIFDKIKSYDDLDNAYRDLASYKSAKDCIVLRWNNMTYYSEAWTNRPEHYWLTVIRDPRDRAVSRYSTHLETNLEFIMHETFHYYDKLTDAAPNQKLMIVYYEDLVRNPSEVIKSIGDFINCKIQTPELVNVTSAGTGKKYKNQGWRTKVKEGDHKVGSEYKGVHTNSIGQWKLSPMRTKPNLVPYYYGLEECIANFDFLERYRDV